LRSRRPRSGRHPNLAHDAAVEVVDAFGRNPVLENLPAADLVNLKAIEVVGVEVELTHISSAAVLDVPVPRDRMAYSRFRTGKKIGGSGRRGGTASNRSARVG
jgi:hypothetical protein